MRFTFAFLFLTFANTAAATGPIGEVVCAPTPVLQERLTRQYHSEKSASGLRNPEEVMEVWTDARGEWAMVIRYSSGNSCIVAFGKYWQQITSNEPS